MSQKKVVNGGVYEGERALFMTENAHIEGATFQNGESPLKESRDLTLHNVTFKWKYPLWYVNNAVCTNCYLSITARSGIWYTNHIVMNNCVVDAPKTFRRASFIVLNDTQINHGEESLWSCSNIKLNNVKVKGDYFGMNSIDVEVNHMEIDGNYLFDGGKNIVVRDSILNSKDAFWNTENVTIINSKIIGEYLGWNSKNVTLINCEISSLQGLCYMEKIKLVNCKLLDSSLVLEYCSDIDADIIDEVESIKNPTSGVIKVKGVKNLIIDEHSFDKDRKKTRIINQDGKEI